MEVHLHQSLVQLACPNCASMRHLHIAAVKSASDTLECSRTSHKLRLFEDARHTCDDIGSVVVKLLQDSHEAFPEPDCVICTNTQDSSMSSGEAAMVG